MFGHFYHEIFRKTIVGFGNIFNNIEIHHKNNSDDNFSIIKVPLAYGPTQKFLARIDQDPTALKPTKITLPRISFEFVGLNYDSSRKGSSTQTFITTPSTNSSLAKKVYMPVPYNMQFELNIMTKLNDDSLQIIEQILPYFQPHYSITINLVTPINEKKDVPIVLESISFNDDYEGDFDNRRALIYTLRFTAKTYLFGPVPDSSTGIIKKATLDYMTDTNTQKREVRYSVTPRATKDYNSDATTTLSADIDDESIYISVSDASSIIVGSRLYIDTEQMYVKSKDGNNLVVIRGYETGAITGHSVGSTVDLITSSDDSLIQIDDDFGFNETTTFFQDFKEYSPSQNIDL
jgi:hypothetical protein